MANALFCLDPTDAPTREWLGVDVPDSWRRLPSAQDLREICQQMGWPLEEHGSTDADIAHLDPARLDDGTWPPLSTITVAPRFVSFRLGPLTGVFTVLQAAVLRCGPQVTFFDGGGDPVIVTTTLAYPEFYEALCGEPVTDTPPWIRWKIRALGRLYVDDEPSPG